ncbi:N-carbamoylputrescine amidase [Triticum urartu]|uniref:N-carbamoylputrescine amidase n=1 Tax=Triticum urartu TaxID=4572 RepID=M7YN42_TRIUA|nr:N-carbamoylputrescine amidase [Triticum urartu]
MAGAGRKVAVAAVQFACTDTVADNVAAAERLIREAHKKGANIVLIQELFEGHYFCQAQRMDFFGRAKPYKENPTIMRMQKLAKELDVVIPVSFFEEAGNAHYNSVAIIDADGTDLGLYRKSHIPDGPGYQEKFYFNPGDTGFKAFKTKYATIGVGICWDQWFPETARAMVLQGAEILFYPTAIGSEPQDMNLDSREHWKRVMQGHAGANLVPLVASNRIGKETVETEHGNSTIKFYGNSFIAGPTGEIVKLANDKDEEVLVAEFDLDEIKSTRHGWVVAFPLIGKMMLFLGLRVGKVEQLPRWYPRLPQHQPAAPALRRSLIWAAGTPFSLPSSMSSTRHRGHLSSPSRGPRCRGQGGGGRGGGGGGAGGGAMTVELEHCLTIVLAMGSPAWSARPGLVHGPGLGLGFEPDGRAGPVIFAV